MSGSRRSAGELAALLIALAGTATAAAERPEIFVPRLPRAPRLEEFLGMRPPDDLAPVMARVSEFVQRVPEDGAPASQATDVWLGHDERNLYVIFVAFDAEPERVRAHLSRRENVFADETVEIQIDSYGDRQRAFSFLTNPYGVQWDAIWTEGQEFDPSWDTVWQSRGERTDRGYVVWMAIPFKSLRFPDAPPGVERRWNALLVRDIPRNNETSFWPPISLDATSRLDRAATLRGFADVETGRNLWLIPYATSRRFRLRDGSGATIEREAADPDAGLDAKWVLRDSLALDLTVNPDYSQVESDQPQVTVNERFEVFFPEQRPFFLENADYFRTPFDLLFTRRVRDPRLGARLTGRAGDYSIGALVVDDEATSGDDPARFDVVRVARELPRQSRVGLLYTGWTLGEQWNRVAGLDARVRLTAAWDTRAQAVGSWTRLADGTRLDDPAWSLEANRNGRHLTAHLHALDVGPEFRTEAGFVTRTDVRDRHGSVGWDFRPEARALVRFRPEISGVRIEDHDGLRLDRLSSGTLAWEWRRKTELALWHGTGRERLRPQDAPSLAASRDYESRETGVRFETEFVTALAVQAELERARTIHVAPPPGQEPQPADRAGAVAGLTLRPTSRLALAATWLATRLDESQGGARILDDRIARLRLDWQIDRRLSLRAIVQHEQTTVDPARTTVTPRDRLNADLLLTWLVNPWSAIYVGTNSNWTDEGLAAGMEASGESLNDGRQLFVKASWLFRP